MLVGRDIFPQEPAGQHPNVQVLSVTGQTHWQTGVTLVLKVTGHGVVIGADGSVIRERNNPICFRLQLGPDDDSRDDDITCPADSSGDRRTPNWPPASWAAPRA